MPFIQHRTFEQVQNKKDRQLMIEQVAVLDLCQQYSTPFYCYSANKIKSQFNMFKNALSHLNPKICYAIKGNSNQAILSLLASQGAGADVVSLGEMKRALMAGIASNKIVFSGVGKTKQEIQFALEHDIFCFNVESEPELELLNKIALSMNKVAPISFRVNPHVNPNTHKKISTGKKGDKFGIDINLAIELYNYANSLQNINLIGLDMHIGSQISDMQAFDLAISKIKQLYFDLKQQGIFLSHVDFGGGLAISYKEPNRQTGQLNIDKEESLLQKYVEVINKHYQDFDCEFIFEPGRFITANSGLLVTQVLYKKSQNNKHYAIVDAAMNDFIRPTLYEAFHYISPVIIKDSSFTQKVDIVGPICESGDFIALDRMLPKLEQNDYIAIHSAGAYCSVASNSYNSRPIIKELLVHDSQSFVIRQEQSIDSIISLDCVPEFLK